MSIDLVVNALKNIAKPAASLVINQAQHNESVVRTLRKQFNFDPVQPPKDVDGVYVYSLIEYGVGKPEAILNLFRENKIKNAFWSAYTANNPLGFCKEVEKFLQGKDLEYDIRLLRIELRSQLEEFGEIFIQIAKKSKSKEFEPFPDWNLDEYPAEFKSLIREKIRSFCGRKFVFETFNQFITKNRSGYFTVMGDAGMGKSTIAAKYIWDNKSPCYFNIRSDGRNRAELFLDSIRKQLIKRYQLQNAEKANLADLLEQVSKKLTAGEHVVIVIDALDEVEQEAGGNLLDLPPSLPERVYFLLTRRPYTIDKKRLSAPDVPVEELDLRGSQYINLSREDIKEYIRFFLNVDQDYKNALRQWMQDRNIYDNDFVEQVATKSENNFMYLRYVLPGITKGDYKDLILKQLPDGLQEYYQDHWRRMGMDEKPQEVKVFILFILVEIGTPIPCEIIAAIAEQDEYNVQLVLDEWVEYLKLLNIEGEYCYSIYHASFLDFLKYKRVLDSKRKLFQEVNQRIAEYLVQKMA
ncbi:MAG: NACHT domain protein [Nostoc sp. DedQUE08]|uniref:NACHT domain protein n=1 Tax=unclassified Nostoc TaxID=2593658 RepID=UPI002AD3F73B|nr:MULTISPECIES: NACHT domain protein [unclassified Nostoc]MDZ8067684.1 NACHT domain protein [Nostoc sp. DedQUE08]MDZ8139916.1 NACHT domain protein [Nostoc sp. DedQUE04]